MTAMRFLWPVSLVFVVGCPVPEKEDYDAAGAADAVPAVDGEDWSDSGDEADAADEADAVGELDAGDETDAGTYQLTGTLTYESVPHSAASGLDYQNVTERPIRGARVCVLSESGDDVLAETISDDNGAYTLEYVGPALIKLWVYSETVDPPVVVEDNTSDDEVYVLETDPHDASASSVLDAVSLAGWEGSSYTGTRIAAPFAILDSAYTAGRRFQEEVSPPPEFPQLRINWSVNNRPESGNPEEGEIGTSLWNGSELYILGLQDVDTDEFDSHVIVHEWGHYFESKMGRSDSIGGYHSLGSILDSRVAFGEGWGNALSAIILDPDSVYRDSYGDEQAGGFDFDLEENSVGLYDRPGWYSEATVQAILYDLYDDANETHDDVALGLGALYEVMVGAQKNTEAFTTLFSFIAGLLASDPQDEEAIAALIAYHAASSDYGVDEIIDEWGTGETHAGGTSGSLPVYTALAIGDSTSANLMGGEYYNTLAQNRYFTFVGDGDRVTVRSTAGHDVDLFVYQQGDYVGGAYTYSGNEEVDIDTAYGARYVVNLQGYEDSSEDYSVLVELESAQASRLHKTAAPVNVSGDIHQSSAVIVVDFDSDATNVAIRVWGAGGLRVRGGSWAIHGATFGRGETKRILVNYAGRGDLAVSVSGSFGGVPGAEVRSFAVNPGGDPMHRKIGVSAIDQRGRAVQVVRAQRR